jgi:hypothetical protein
MIELQNGPEYKAAYIHYSLSSRINKATATALSARIKLQKSLWAKLNSNYFQSWKLTTD